MKNRFLLCVVFALIGAVVFVVLIQQKDTIHTPSTDSNTFTKLKVLIITPDSAVGYGQGIKNLLEDYELQADVVEWKKATIRFTKEYDVLIVTGLGRNPDKKEVRLDYKKPVVAYGPYGCVYLGFLQLKNGHPYT